MTFTNQWMVVKVAAVCTVQLYLLDCLQLIFFFIGQVSCVSIEGLAGLTHLKRSQSLFGPVHKLRRLSGNGVSGQSLRPIKTSFMFGQNLREWWGLRWPKKSLRGLCTAHMYFDFYFLQITTRLVVSFKYQSSPVVVFLSFNCLGDNILPKLYLHKITKTIT